ncbi:hypothetical protein CCAN11_720002 [Capnocytophaga canimorsus]|uniref:Uncharacterized protein n=1 Tax=Capnocytophaga canimorsus TaxID=28188 RepID=A0A0B7IRN8_9FLAO|nr:hypothetical protein CCAN11_720002 [Capnocytophaga canimorsus]
MSSLKNTDVRFSYILFFMLHKKFNQLSKHFKPFQPYHDTTSTPDE